MSGVLLFCHINLGIMYFNSMCSNSHIWELNVVLIEGTRCIPAVNCIFVVFRLGPPWLFGAQ